MIRDCNGWSFVKAIKSLWIIVYKAFNTFFKTIFFLKSNCKIEKAFKRLQKAFFNHVIMMEIWMNFFIDFSFSKLFKAFQFTLNLEFFQKSLTIVSFWKKLVGLFDCDKNHLRLIVEQLLWKSFEKLLN